MYRSSFLLIFQFTIITTSPSYLLERKNFIHDEQSRAIGACLTLSSKEKQVNDIVMGLKLAEWDDAFINPENFLPAIHFFQSKPRIEQSKVFQFIQKLPKGALLHGHDTSLNSFEYLFNLTYREGLYGCIVNGNLNFRFFGEIINDTSCDWKLLKTFREEDGRFDDYVKSQLTLIVDDPYEAYPTINAVWIPFGRLFGQVAGIVGYRPVFQEYFYQTMKEFYEDNVIYLEIRAFFSEVYELNGTTYSDEEIVQLYKETLEEFKRDYPDFHGVRLIHDFSRHVDNATADQYVTKMKLLQQLHPNFIAGFDLDAQEDKGKPLVDFRKQLFELAESKIKFFFHAAETDWNGASTDYNLVDAVLFNTSRIGHGFGIVKHPKVLEAVKEKGIAIEISPISNQVLTLVKDLRNHPGNYLFAENFPVVISCDNPSFWGVKGLSYDFYMAFMGLASRSGDLRVLKQLALNSVIYSAMEEEEKAQVLEKWQIQWNQFLDNVLVT